MDATQAVRARGLSIRWVEVTDESGRSRLEMRWRAAVPEVPAVPAAVRPAARARAGTLHPHAA